MAPAIIPLWDHEARGSSEHPFGTVKRYDGAHYFLCRGIQKTTAEAGLSFLAYNLRRSVNLVGTEALLEALRKKQMRKEG